jgi:hypothetical protein
LHHPRETVGDGNELAEPDPLRVESLVGEHKSVRLRPPIGDHPVERVGEH